MPYALFKHLSLSKSIGYIKACFHGDRSSSASNTSDGGKTAQNKGRKAPKAPKAPKNTAAQSNARFQSDSDHHVPQPSPAQNFVGPLRRQEEEEVSDSGRPDNCIPVEERRRRKRRRNKTSTQNHGSNDQTAQQASSS